MSIDIRDYEDYLMDESDKRNESLMKPVKLVNGMVPPEQCDGNHYLSRDDFPGLYAAIGWFKPRVVEVSFKSPWYQWMWWKIQGSVEEWMTRRGW